MAQVQKNDDGGKKKVESKAILAGQADVAKQQALVTKLSESFERGRVAFKTASDNKGQVDYTILATWASIMATDQDVLIKEQNKLKKLEESQKELEKAAEQVHDVCGRPWSDHPTALECPADATCRCANCGTPLYDDAGSFCSKACRSAAYS